MSKKDIQHDSPIFTSFRLTRYVSRRLQQILISIWLDRALITLSDCMVLFQFSSDLHETIKRFLELPQQNFCKSLFHLNLILFS